MIQEARVREKEAVVAFGFHTHTHTVVSSTAAVYSIISKCMVKHTTFYLEA